MSLTGYKLKTADESRTSSAVLAVDNTLFFTPAQNTAYLVRGLLIAQAGTTPDFKCNLFAANAQSFMWCWNGTPAQETLPVINSRSIVTRVDDINNITVSGAATTGHIALAFKGLFVSQDTASPPDFQVLWSQVTSNAAATTLMAGSWLTWEALDAGAPSEALSGTATLTFDATATLIGPSGTVSGTVALAFSASAAVAASGTMSGAVALTFSASAPATARGTLAGNAALSFTPTATGIVTRVYGPAPLPSLTLLGGFS